LLQSGFFLGTQHGFRILTEEGTRKGMAGPFFRGWYESLSNLHGWSDGDGFLVNYVGHPIQGSTSAYIFVHNDGRARFLEYENSRAYWRSRLRATLWSWAYSTQFEIGPVSEASIGKIQSRYPQQGFVDHVATPTIGLAWMIAEDALDRYVIRPFENRCENVWARMMVRGWLNPTRSMANMMRGRVPWWRDSRGGIWSYRAAPYERFVDRAKASRPQPGWTGIGKVEFDSASAYWVNPGGPDGNGALHCIGGYGRLQYNNSPRWAWVAEAGGCKMFGFEGKREFNFSGDILTYGFGRRRTWRGLGGGRWSPYAQFLIGGKRITINEEIVERRNAWQAANPGKKPGYEFHNLWTKFNQANGFGVQLGAGLEYNVSDVLALQLGAIDYNKAWMPAREIAAYPHSLRVSLGLKIRMGNW
jgi:hypothetical protein